MTEEIKLVFSYIGDSCSHFLDMSFESIIDVAEKIIFVWGMKDQKTKEKLLKWQKKYPEKFVIIESKYDDEDKTQNGRQRNVYLNYLKKNHKGDWNLTLDPDELVERPENIKPIIKKIITDKYRQNTKQFIMSPYMRHLIQDISHEDATLSIHFCNGRLFNINDELFYPQVEHPIIQYKDRHLRGTIVDFCIWHIGYIPYVFDQKRRYESNLKKSNMHTKENLFDWYLAHSIGRYRTKEVPSEELPMILKKHLLLENLNEIMYFQDKRNLENKHWYDCWLWKNYFKPKKIIFIGCGYGHRVFTMNGLEVESLGFDFSKYAIENTPYKHLKNKLFVDDIVNLKHKEKYDLVICFDVLEHIKEKDLPKALENIYKLSTKNFLFSIPFLDNPDLTYDKTHKIFKSKEWWLEQIQKTGIRVIETSKEFLYTPQFMDSDQIIIGVK